MSILLRIFVKVCIIISLIFFYNCFSDIDRCIRRDKLSFEIDQLLFIFRSHDRAIIDSLIILHNPQFLGRIRFRGYKSAFGVDIVSTSSVTHIFVVSRLLH